MWLYRLCPIRRWRVSKMAKDYVCVRANEFHIDDGCRVFITIEKISFAEYNYAVSCMIIISI